MSKELNILFSGFLYPFNYPLIDRIRNKFRPKKIIHIGDNKIYKSDFEREGFKFGFYYGYIFFIFDRSTLIWRINF